MSEEHRTLAVLQKKGLSRDVGVVVAFVVPFYPKDKWDNNIPPPEQVEQFAPYLKYVIASHTRVSVIVTMDKWSARYVMSGCNYEYMQYKPNPPGYGLPVRGINLYPISAKNRVVKACGLKLVHMPHACMWTKGKDKALEQAFCRGVERIQEGMLRSNQSELSAYELMFRAAKDMAENEAREAEEFVPRPHQDDTAPDDATAAMFGEDDRSRVGGDPVDEALRRAGLRRGMAPESVWFQTYDDNIWKIPRRYERFGAHSKEQCLCPRCTSPLNPVCRWINRDSDPNERPCNWCCCAHGHRNPMGECVERKGCRGWSVPPLPDDAPALTRLHANSQIPFPTLEQLCVERIRRSIDDTQYSPASLDMHLRAGTQLPRAQIDRWFRPCCFRALGPSASMWLAITGCCKDCQPLDARTQQAAK